MDELKSYMQVLLNQQDLMAPFMEQRLLLQFSNTMLKRRDFFLASKEVQKLKPTTIQQMRASPLVGPELLSLPQELIDEETDIKSTKSFLHQLVVGQKKWYMNTQPTGRVSGAVPSVAGPSKPSAAAGSAAQLAAMSSGESAASWAHSQPRDQPFKARRPVATRAPAGRGSRKGGKGGKKSSWSRGKAPFLQGRGKPQ